MGTERIITKLSNYATSFGCLCLYVIALWIFGGAIHSVYMDLSGESFTIYKLLDEVALIVFAIAVIDVSRYLMIEEVLRKHDRSPYEARMSFTKFIIIIVTALCLEGLVLTIETAKSDVTMMIYPIVLFFTATALILSLALYQKMNSSVEDK